MKLNRINKPHAKPTVNEFTPEIGALMPLMEFTQFTINTGAVCRGEPEDITAKVAPVSLTLLVNTIMAPERIEYFVRGNTIDLKTVKGFAPNVFGPDKVRVSNC
jgi:hypothetical protein